MRALRKRTKVPQLMVNTKGSDMWLRSCWTFQPQQSTQMRAQVKAAIRVTLSYSTWNIWDQPTQRIERNDTLILLKSVSVELLVMQQSVSDIVGLDDTGWYLRKSKHGLYSQGRGTDPGLLRTLGMDFKESIIIPETIYKIVSSWHMCIFLGRDYSVNEISR